MSPTNTSPFLRVWYKWKALRLPWRRKFLVGMDLHGNSYWEFRLSATPDAAGRWRRIVQYPRKTHHGDVTVSPAWHQWLRYTRPAPPTIEEQRADVARQERMKVLAAEADARWAAKPSLVDAPTEAREQSVPQSVSQPQPAPGEVSKGGQPQAKTGESEGGAAVPREETWRRMREGQSEQPTGKGFDPWKQQAPTGPSEMWQPKKWKPPSQKS